MTPQRKKRLLTIAFALGGMGIATALILTAFEKNLMYFYSPSEVMAGEAPQGRKFRVGGLVVEGSVKRVSDSLSVEFSVTDTVNKVPVIYTGILPDLFREGQGIVAHGERRADGVFEVPWPNGHGAPNRNVVFYMKYYTDVVIIFHQMI